MNVQDKILSRSSSILLFLLKKDLKTLKSEVQCLIEDFANASPSKVEALRKLQLSSCNDREEFCCKFKKWYEEVIYQGGEKERLENTIDEISAMIQQVVDRPEIGGLLEKIKNKIQELSEMQGSVPLKKEIENILLEMTKTRPLAALALFIQNCQSILGQNPPKNKETSWPNTLQTKAVHSFKHSGSRRNKMGDDITYYRCSEYNCPAKINVKNHPHSNTKIVWTEKFLIERNIQANFEGK